MCLQTFWTTLVQTWTILLANFSNYFFIKLLFCKMFFVRSISRSNPLVNYLFAVSYIVIIIFWFHIIDKPEVTISLSSSHTVIEGQRATLECTLTAANPNTSITWKWFKTAYPITVLLYGPTYTILNVHRNMSDSYSCTAINSVGVSKAAMIYLDVQCKYYTIYLWWMIVNVIPEEKSNFHPWSKQFHFSSGRTEH